MERIIRAFPLLPGKREAFENFQKAMRERSTEASAFYTSLNVVRESWHLQHTPHGDVIIACTELSDAKAAAPQYAKSIAPFDAWFKKCVHDITGINPNEQPLGPDCECVFDWKKG